VERGDQGGAESVCQRGSGGKEGGIGHA